MDLEEEFKEIKNKAIELRNESSYLLYNKHIYEFVRREKPEIVVEAGVAGGATSYCILKAMDKNDKGTLYSFDPGHDHVEDESHIGLEDAKYKEHPPGHYIPESLKQRWRFTQTFFDKAVEDGLLEPIKGEVDIFFHDSDHSDENINKEFKLMKDYVKEDGYFLIHDRPTDKVWEKFKLVEANNIEHGNGLVTKEDGLTNTMMRIGNNKWALKVFKRNENS